MAKNKSYIKQVQHYERIFKRLKLIGLNLFEWQNLPNGIQSRHIERALYNYGQAFFYQDETYGLICLQCSNGGNVNIYGDPLNVIVNGYGFSKNLSIDKGVRILNNDDCISTNIYVQDYATRMQIVEQAINTNISQQKFPYFIKTDKNSELTIKNIYKKFEDGEFVIFGDNSLELNDLKIINTTVPFVADKLNQYKYDLEREILTFFGLNNSFEKKERLLVDEVNSNNDYVSKNIDLMYKCRRLACEEINKKFGLNITVKKLHTLKEKEEI